MLDDTSKTEAEAPATETATPATPAAAPAETKIVVETKSPEQAEQDAEAQAEQDLRADQEKALERARSKKEGRDPVVKSAADRAAKTSETGKAEKDAATGKFVAKPSADAKPGHNQPPAKTEADKPDADKPAVTAKPPQSWSKEAKALWDKMPPELQAYTAEQDKVVARAFTQTGQKTKALERALESYKPLNETLGKYADTLKGWGMTPHDAFDGMMQNTIDLSRNPKQAVIRIAKEYGVDIAALAYESLDPNSLPPDPRVAERDTEILALRRQLHEAQNLLTADRTQMRERQELERQQERSYQAQQVRGGIDELAKTLPDFDVLEEDIADILPSFIRKHGNTKEAIIQAHKAAMAANPVTQQKMIEDRMKAADAERTKLAKQQSDAAIKAARLNAPGNMAPAPEDDEYAIQAAALKRARDKASSRRAI
jgi:hypothetical protein